jgi:hypothetical protein
MVEPCRSIVERGMHSSLDRLRLASAARTRVAAIGDQHKLNLTDHLKWA